MTAKLRIVVFTAGGMTAIDRVFCENLAADPLFDFAAIVVDGWRPRPKPLARRIARALREDGPAWLAFKLRSKIRSAGERMIGRALDRIHSLRTSEAARPLPPVIHVDDLHAADSISRIRALGPDLGVIVGGRILKDAITTIPRYGSVNIHKLKLPEHRGGGPVGYWEVLNGEACIGVSIHYATSAVDAGPVLAQSTIPIEACDTLESLRIKADLRGAELYHEALRRFALGERTGTPQDLSRGTTHRAPSEYKVWRLQRSLERKAARRFGTTPALRSRLARLRVTFEWLALLPRLIAARRQLARDGRAPIATFFYHLVADAPLNHMCLPLPIFVRQMELLRRYYAILPLPAAVARLRSGHNGQVAACITFDDGYRANEWAVRWLRHMRVPAAFFISTGHVRDGSSFEHDRTKGYEAAAPMTAVDVRSLAANGFTIGSHGVHHEDFGTLDRGAAEAVLRDSKEAVAEMSGVAPPAFAFPKGQRGRNITPDALALALQHYDSVFSAYGGYSFPREGRRHFLRLPNPTDVFGMHLAMTGYTGFRDCLRGNAWGLRTETLDPAARDLRVALIAASPEVIGGHSVQAAALASELRSAGHEVNWIPVDAPFPRALRWVKRIPYVRTVCNEMLYAFSLAKVRRADVVHIFAASYWSFLLGPAAAMIAARVFGKRVVLHYHSGEADDHLTRWGRIVRPLLRLAHEIVVPSEYLQRVFARHGYRSRVILNAIDAKQFRYRERVMPRPHLLSVRNLESHYRVENTVAAFAELKQRFPDATLTIAGYGSREGQLRRLAAGIGGIRFLGRVEPSALPAVYDEADVFVNSSIIDNQPVSILEAFASGLPVVSTPTGDIPSMLRHGEAGFLIGADDPASLAAAVTRVIEDPDTSLRISRRARAEVERYASARIGEQWTALYARVLHA